MNSNQLETGVHLTQKGADILNKLSNDAVKACKLLGLPEFPLPTRKAGDYYVQDQSFLISLQEHYGKGLWTSAASV